MLVAIALIAATVGLAQAARRSPAAGAVAIDTLPLSIGPWRGSEAGALDEETQRILAADAYLNRTYVSEAGQPIGLYAAYYAQQRPGVSIHSPLHCLPGTGWEPIDVASLDGFRRLIVRKDRQEAVVLYWYAIHGRTVGRELQSKAWLLHDSIRFGRSDAALIRVVVPVTDSIETAERNGLAFARTLLPSLSHLWS